MPLGREVGLSPSDIVLMGTQLPLPKMGAEPPIFGRVYCGQTVGWIKMQLGMEVGLGPGHVHCARWGPSSPSPKVHSPQFSAHICCGQMAGWIKMPLGREIGLSPSDIVLDGDPAPPLQNGSRAPNFRPCLLWMDQDATWRGGRSRPRPHCARWGPSSPFPKGAQPPIFGPCVVAKWLDGSRCHLVGR